MIITGDRNICIYCKSNKIIKHGSTATGNKRYRCRVCSKTWVDEKFDIKRPEFHEIVEAYLNGRTYRDLVELYHTSPLRINQKIRLFLNDCPDWEEYLDVCVPNHRTILVYLVGKSFSCSTKTGKNNSMYVVMAIDALSTVVLGMQIGAKDSKSLWNEMLSRLKKRNISVPTFMTNGSKHIEDAVRISYPDSAIRIYYHRAYRDKELMCCLTRLPINNKLINDALQAFETFDSNILSDYLKKRNASKIEDIILNHPEHFTKRLKERLDSRPRIRVEGLSSAFQARFEKFHMLKGEPFPVVNAWIAKWMLNKQDFGFNRLSIYMQIPANANFKQFSCGQVPETSKFKIDDNLLENYVVEVAARSLQIPVFYSSCEMKLDKCSLY